MAASEDRDGSQPPRPRFAIQATNAGRTYVVRALGELDLDHAEEFRRAIDQAEASDAQRVLVDLDGLWFIDSTGLRVLVAAGRSTAANLGRLRFTRGTGDVAAMFRLTALDQTMPFE